MLENKYEGVLWWLLYWFSDYIKTYVKKNTLGCFVLASRNFSDFRKVSQIVKFRRR